MIAKRVMQALKRQDWTMVFIEFVLVVLGVVMGFQINDWGTERAEARERLEATDRLLEEAELDVAYLRQAVVRQRGVSEAVNFALERLEAGHLDRTSRPHFAAGLFGLEGSLPLEPPSSVYDDVVSAGELGRMGDPQLREAIADYRAALNFDQRVAAEIQSKIHSSITFPAVTVHYHPSQTGDQTRIDFDFEGLLKDQSFRKEMVRAGQMHVFLLARREEAFEAAVRMCTLLGHWAGRRCKLDRG
jgi:hypothetical protein